MKIRPGCILLLAVLTAVATGAVASAGTSDLPADDITTTVEASSGRVTGNGGSGLAAAILCGGFSRMAPGSGMNAGVLSAAIASCAYMILDGFFDFPW